jgi:hypothetical protein
MKNLQSCATWIAGKLHSLGAMFDPEVLQWPGGIVIALFFFCIATLSLACGSGRAAAAPIAPI